jgi:hypothetical protein
MEGWRTPATPLRAVRPSLACELTEGGTAECVLLDLPHHQPQPHGRDELDQRQPPVEEQQLDASDQQDERAGRPRNRREVAPRLAELMRGLLDLLWVGIRDRPCGRNEPRQREA